ncbi:Mg2 transporter protein CorA family protein [Denitrovibrio acetiphilus DSM 12809]|uniref:Mg2 transporter protein CorA family protein n=1 Tax=Denitrovibrio acetiphilus (strain DSM 12809 / NBRC 114555 / N2460) TaxID=522772 RepID=D4H6U1_DENA2|nr:zinc transporter ZntB [Denitrovibrio acetiphilus]ADD67807.1 Mg2 transporter protein CorA family protein [Denitrovibrio acetiphilus DSM 12809]
MSEHILQNLILTENGRWVDMKDIIPEEDSGYMFHWIHLHRESLGTQKWLFQQDIDELIIESLTDEDTRPRTTVFPDGILLNMRAVNVSKGEQPYEMLSMRIFMQKNRIISTSLKNIHVIKDILEVINGHSPPESKGDFLAYVIELITDRIEAYIAEKKDWIFDFECHVIDHTALGKQNVISDIRRSSVTYTRYLSPQKDALVKLISLKENIFNEDDRAAVVECINNTSRYLEDLEAITNRCHIIKDDLNAVAAEKMNKNMYLLSIMTAVFLPLSFLTGLLGVNLGGIPGAGSSEGFTIFSIILAVVLVTQIIILKISKRF